MKIVKIILRICIISAAIFGIPSGYKLVEYVFGSKEGIRFEWWETIVAVPGALACYLITVWVCVGSIYFIVMFLYWVFEK